MDSIDPQRSTLAGQQFWAQPWLLTAVLMHVASLWIYAQKPSINQFSPVVYGMSVVVGVSLWLLLNLLRDTLGPTGRKLFGAMIAPMLATIIVGNYFFYLEFGEYFSASMVKFALAGNAGMSLHYAAGYLTYPQNVIFVAGLAAFAALWIWGKPVRFATRRARRWTSLGAGAMLVVSLAATCIWSPRQRIAPDAALLTALGRAMVLPKANSLRAADREPVPKTPSGSTVEAGNAEPPPNVVLIVHESWAKRHIGFYGADDETMPFLASWMDRESDNFFVYDRAYTHSTTTELSMPAILTGVGPWESAEKLHRMPFAWEWARSVGLQPFFLTSQSYDFQGYGEFFFGKETLPHKTADDIKNDQIKNFGTDELAVVKHFGRMLQTHTGGQRFFGIYNSNALHKPVQAESPLLEEPPPFEMDHKRALYIIDRATESIVEDVREAGQMDNTVFIFTSDHGELPERSHLPPRVVSFYDEFTNIPFLIRVPPSWTEKYPERLEALRTNQSRMVGNVDVLPTIIEAVGAAGNAPQLWDALDGQSLFEPSPEDRTLIALNTNEIRHWEHEGFGLYWKHWRLVVSDIEGAQLFNVAEDPNQKNDVWDRAPREVRRHFRHVIERNHHLERLWSSYR